MAEADLAYSSRSIQLCNVLLNWLDFFYQFLLKILRAVGHHSLLSTSSSSKDGFKPLPDVSAEPPISVEIASARTSTEGQVSSIQKLTVVLDLDETLVSAYETSSLPALSRTQAIEAGLKWFELEYKTKDCNAKPITSYVTVFERPGLHEFLEQLSQFAHLILFTAAVEDYARPLVDRIDTQHVLKHRLYRPSTISTQYRDHVKDLLCVSKNMCRTVIVDNNPYCFLLQPLNGIPCDSFSAEQPNNDSQLLDVVLPLLKQLSEEEDVRLALYDRFHMPEWFEKQGIPRSCWTSSSQTKALEFMYRNIEESTEPATTSKYDFPIQEKHRARDLSYALWARDHGESPESREVVTVSNEAPGLPELKIDFERSYTKERPRRLLSRCNFGVKS